MRIAYLTTVRLPSERAHGHQIAQVCDALAKLGHVVTIFAPYRRNPVKESFRAYYGLTENVLLRTLGAFDPIDHPWIPRLLQLPLLHLFLRRYLQTALIPPAYDLFYTRSPALLSLLTTLAVPTVLELHQVPSFRQRRFLRYCNRCRLVVCLTSPMRQQLLALGVDPARVIVEGDAVDLARFVQQPSVAEARTQFSCQTERIIVGYVGRLRTLGMEKGVLHLLQALARLKEEKRFFGLIVGGPEADRTFYAAAAAQLGLTEHDVRFCGEVPSADVPGALAACDILAMPFPDLPHYRTNMSPLKMFEYMASGKPILTSDLPTVRDVLNEETAFFCRPGDSEHIADVLRFIADHWEEAQNIGARARLLVERHTWEERMQRILQNAMVAI